MNREPDIVIVGAGAAGIGAARRLAGSGLTATILEALPRLGGRAWTQNIAGMALDMGCEWLHSADKNPWTAIAAENGFQVQQRDPGWRWQYRNLGFSAVDQEAARSEFTAWNARLIASPPASDCAVDALDPAGQWAAYLQARSGFFNGDELERISATDYANYDLAATDFNWRLPAGYGTLITSSLPAETTVKLGTAVEAIEINDRKITLRTNSGAIKARAVILTVSTNVLARDLIALPAALNPWREAARRLPLGDNEKLFLEIIGASPFEPDTRVIGNPRAPETGTYNIRPFSKPVISCFLGGAGARAVAKTGHDMAFVRAIDQLADLFGADIRKCLRPLTASNWAGTPTIGGGYSHALPGQADARAILAKSFDGLLFFAGEATHSTNFSTAHGAYQTGLRAAEEAVSALKKPV